MSSDGGADALSQPSSPRRRGPDEGAGARRVGRPGLPWLLFGLTALTTTWALGLAGAATLLGILGAHEMGHYWVARRAGVPASPPHFIPLPPVGGLPGTLGAVIGIGADRANRDQLARIAVAGPLAGFVVAVPAFAWALSQPSETIEMSGDVLLFGRSLLSGFLEDQLSAPLPPGMDHVANPVYFAAWLGLFITGLNLLPMGQLDGGHLMYAVSPKYAPVVSRAVFTALLVLGAIGACGTLVFALSPTAAESGAWVEATRPLRQWAWPGFLIWAFLARIFGLRHPPIRDEQRPLSRSGRGLAALGLALLVIVFVPNGVWAERFPETPTAREAPADG